MRLHDLPSETDRRFFAIHLPGSPVAEMARKAPGMHRRKGVGQQEAHNRWGTPEGAEKWLESIRWPGGGGTCPKCGSDRTTGTTHKSMPCACKDCRKRFSLKTGTPMANSRLGYDKWVLGAYNFPTNPKGAASMESSRDLVTTQRTAWYLHHRYPEAFVDDGIPSDFMEGGDFQIDEAFMGEKEKNNMARTA